MRRWKEYRAMLRRGDAEHLRRLAADGMTVEVDQVDPSDTVIRIRLGFGDEFWRVQPGYSPNPVEGKVDGGQLIVEGGVRVVDPSRLSFLETKIQDVVYAV